MKFFQQFKTWQFYARPLLLAAAVFYIHFLSTAWGTEAYAIAHKVIGMPALFLFYAAGLLIADKLILFILRITNPAQTHLNRFGGKS